MVFRLGQVPCYSFPYLFFSDRWTRLLIANFGIACGSFFMKQFFYTIFPDVVLSSLLVAIWLSWSIIMQNLPLLYFSTATFSFFCRLIRSWWCCFNSISFHSRLSYSFFAVLIFKRISLSKCLYTLSSEKLLYFRRSSISNRISSALLITIENISLVNILMFNQYYILVNPRLAKISVFGKQKWTRMQKQFIRNNMFKRLLLFWF